MTIMVWVAVAVGAIPVALWVVWWWNELRYAVPINRRCGAEGVKLPPGHMGFPFFGEMASFLWYFQIRRRPDDFINSRRHKYGDGVGLYRTHLFGKPSIIACFPTVNKFIFQSNDFILDWPNMILMDPNYLVMGQGNAHDRTRRFVLDCINNPDSLRRITLMLQPLMVSALHSWAERGRVRAYNGTKRVTLENIGKLFASLEAKPQLDVLEHLFDGFLKGFIALPLNLPGTAFRHALQCREKLEAFFREEHEKKKTGSRATTEDQDLMDGLMQIKDENGDKLSDQEVLDNMLILIFAGYESSAVASVWAIYYLAKYPDVLHKLREENKTISLSKKGEYITYEDVSNMKYTNKVAEEVLRLANVVAVAFRLATQDIDYKGYRIPKGWKVILWIRYLHTNPDNFQDPLCFNPERWNEPAKPGTYQAFGGGRRICPGNMLARLQIAIFLHHLSLGYKWRLINPEADIVYLTTPIPTDGVEIAFSRL